MATRGIDALWRHAERTAGFGYIDWGRLSGASVLVTGATGLIGSHVVRTLAAANRARRLGLRVAAAVRDEAAARERLAGADAELIRWEATEPLEPAWRADFIVHAASPTSSRAFVEKPVETIESVVAGGKAALELCRRDGGRAVLLSSMEVYGRACGRIDEGAGGDFDSMRVRSSYPEAKRLVECLCAAYASELGSEACVVRLAQTFGQGVAPDDGRAFAEFGRCALAGKDIVLATAGQKRNPYLSVDDAAGAVLCALLEGRPGAAYNAANEKTYCSVLQMSEAVLGRYAPEAGVIAGADAEKAKMYREASELDMDCSKLRALGWEASDSLEEMYEAMFEWWSKGRVSKFSELQASART